MPIQSLQFTNVGPFRPRPDGSGSDGIKLEFDPNVNLFIGPNNVGKSTILQVLAAVTAQEDGVINTLPQAFKKATTDRREGYTREDADFSLTWTNPVGDYRRLWDILSGWALGGDGFYGFPSEYASLEIGSPNGLIEVAEINWNLLSSEFGYVGYYNSALRGIVGHHVNSPIWAGVRVNSETGARERISSSQYRVSDDPDDDRNVHAAVAYRYGGGSDQRIFQNIEQVTLEIATGFKIDIGTGVFGDDDPSESNHRKGQSKFSTMDGSVTYPELSHGTRTTLAWVSHFIVGMAQRYYGEPDWKERPGIFIIDEIDAHLHPSWQRRIIPTLQRHFPNVQIFASTHSPMMVAGLQKGQVHLLKRNETTREVEWSRNEQDIIGWTADEIYRTFMGIDDPTDYRTAWHAEELRELRNKDSLTPEDEARMQELRRLVNEDLLAGGWLKAQDERFDEMMRRFMANRMSDLSQDGA